MTFHSLALLQTWVSEFSASRDGAPANVRVIVQDGDGGADTGLVEVRMLNASTVTTIEPESVGSPRWLATFEAREEPIRMHADAIRALAQELTLVAELCAFLEVKAAVSGD